VHPSFDSVPVGAKMPHILAEVAIYEIKKET
jgi:hypothetical protein